MIWLEAIAIVASLVALAVTIFWVAERIDLLLTCLFSLSDNDKED